MDKIAPNHCFFKCNLFLVNGINKSHMLRPQANGRAFRVYV